MQADKKKIKPSLRSLETDELSVILTEMGEPGFRAAQIFKWTQSAVRSFDDMTNVPKALREKLSVLFSLDAPNILQKQTSKQDGTIKYLWGLADGNSVESVVMRYEHGNTVCISSQVGCRMGCAFCASTIGGLLRLLKPSEMLEQVIFSQADSNLRISNIVLMGIGEPLDNFDNVIKFLRLVNHPEGMDIGMRHISLSTCGPPDKVDKLGEYNLQLTLSVSLHAPDDETRSTLMPVNRAFGVDRLIDSCRRYFEKTGRRVSFEYAMIDGVNDTRYHAQLLVEKLKGMGCHLNLIPLNNVAESSFKPSKPENMRAFIAILEKGGINTTVRRKLGGDIDASCGQLRRKIMGAQV